MQCLFYFASFLVINKFHMFMHDHIFNGKQSKYFAGSRILELMNYGIVFWDMAVPKGK